MGAGVTNPVGEAESALCDLISIVACCSTFAALSSPRTLAYSRIANSMTRLV